MQAYKLGNFNQIADIYQLKKRILMSLNFSLTETERLLLDLVDKATLHTTVNANFFLYSGRGKFMPLPLKSKILEIPGSLVTDDIKMFPL